MEQKVVMREVSCVLHVVAFALALAAEFNRSSAKIGVDSYFNYSYCNYTSNIASAHGMGAVVFLLASHGLVLAATGFLCRVKGSSPIAVSLYTIVWVTFVGGEACLVVGTMSNNRQTKYRTIFGSNAPLCHTLRKGVFGAGAGFTLASALASQLYYFIDHQSSPPLQENQEMGLKGDEPKASSFSPESTYQPGPVEVTTAEA